MTLESMVAVGAACAVEALSPRKTDGRLVALAAATLLLLPAHAADPGGSTAVGKNSAVTFESISGSTAKRVILTSKAAERLGIETGKVGEEMIVRKQMVSGLVIPPQPELKAAAGSVGDIGKPAVPTPKPAQKGTFGGFGKAAAAPPAGGSFAGFGKVAATTGPLPVAPQAVAPQAKSPATSEVWVLVTLSPGEWDRLARDKPARVLPLATRDKLESEVMAKPSGMPPLEDAKRSMLTLYYVVPGKDHGLTLNSRMRVELPLSGSDEKQKVVPYGAVYYDGKGTAWVYVNPRSLEFERKRIGVERVVGDLAVLSDGPPVGTPVVTVGAALLYGAEIFGK